jgi:predicted membrane protein
MNGHVQGEHGGGKRRRWFLGLEPIFEGGRRGKHAQTWDVEDELVAVALLGDVSIDLSQTRSMPAEVAIEAYAILRDIDVLVSEGTRVELSGGVVRGDLRNEAPAVSEEQSEHTVRVQGHSLLGDVNVRPVARERR